jgi:hypothetical protein
MPSPRVYYHYYHYYLDVGQTRRLLSLLSGCRPDPSLTAHACVVKPAGGAYAPRRKSPSLPSMHAVSRSSQPRSSSNWSIIRTASNVRMYVSPPPCGYFTTATMREYYCVSWFANHPMREYRHRHHAGILLLILVRQPSHAGTSPPPPCGNIAPPPCGNIATAYCGNIASMIIAYCVGVASMDMYEILRRMFVLEGRQRRSRCYYTIRCYTIRLVLLYYRSVCPSLSDGEQVR